MIIFLRVARRRTAWEDADLDQIIDAEFRTRDGAPDLTVSVYEIDSAQSQVIRTHAEHAAGARLDPPRGGDNFDLSSEERAVIAAAADGPFEFTRSAHRELHFSNEEDLRSFIDRVIRPQIHRRRFPTTKAELRTYVAGRLAAQDPEWVTVVADLPNWKA